MEDEQVKNRFSFYANNTRLGISFNPDARPPTKLNPIMNPLKYDECRIIGWELTLEKGGREDFKCDKCNKECEVEKSYYQREANAVLCRECMLTFPHFLKSETMEFKCIKRVKKA